MSSPRRPHFTWIVPDRREALTRRWARAIELIERDGAGASASSFIAAHPELGQADRFRED